MVVAEEILHEFALTYISSETNQLYQILCNAVAAQLIAPPSIQASSMPQLQHCAGFGISSQTPTSRHHCVSAGHQAQAHGFRLEAVRAATGTLDGQLERVRLWELLLARP